MSRTKYLSHLERQMDASRKAIDDLTRENHELKSLLREVVQAQKPSATSNKSNT